MKTKQLTTGVIGFVELRDNWSCFKLKKGYNMLFFRCKTPEGRFAKGCTDIEEGSWRIIEPTEEVLREVMPNIFDMYFFNYLTKTKNTYGGGFEFDTALESFQTLKQSLGIDEAKRYVVLFKKD